MKRKQPKALRLTVCLLSAVVLLLSGCAAAKEAAEVKPLAKTGQESGAIKEIVPENTDYAASGKGDYPYTFTDSLGNSVTLQEQPKKVAVLFSSYADIWQTAGGEVAITVGDSIERGFASADCILVDEGSGHSVLNTELLIASQPDLVIGTTDYDVQKEAIALCARSGIPAAAFQVDTFEDYLGLLQICTRITGQEPLYREHGVEVAAKIDALLACVQAYNMSLAESDTAPGTMSDPQSTQKSAPNKTILFVRAGSSDRSTKAKTADENFVCVMLEQLGTYNIADNAPILLDGLSIEEILRSDPDHIFITTMGDEAAAKEHMQSVLESAGWKELTAVQEKAYTYLPKELFHYKPNSRWYEAYRYLAEILYPELQF